MWAVIGGLRGAVVLAVILFPVAPARAAPAPGPVVLAGIPGLRADDLSATGTPMLWRLLTTGASGSLSVRAVRRTTCPADGWLTLNAGARTATPAEHGCPFPPVLATSDGGARVDGVAGAHREFDAVFGTLAASAERVGCVSAVGPGAALALAGADGRVARYAVSFDGLDCPLTVVDLGALPESSASAGRSEALRRADAEVARLAAALPPDATLVVAGLADSSDTAPRLHVAIATGPSFSRGRLDSASTRQPGLVQLTDLTPTILSLLGAPPTHPLVGSVVHREAAEGAADRLRGQAIAADVQRDALVPFFAGLAAALLLLTAAALRFRLRPVAVALACVPAATFLANVCPWWTFPAPAAVLAATIAAATAVLWALATFGPWRRHPWGAPGFIALATAGLLATDAITGSRLQMCTLYGQSPLIAGRFYGFGNSTFAVFAVATLLGAAALATSRRRPGPIDAAASLFRPTPTDGAGSPDRSARTNGAASPGRSAPIERAARRRRSGMVAAVVGLVAVAVDGWPGWGADVGGVLALVPSFALLGLWLSGVRVTVRRAALAAAGGVAVLAVVAIVDWLRPAGARSHLGAFVQQLLDGRAGAVLSRKVSTNLHTFTDNPLALLVPVALAIAVIWLARPTPRLAEASRRLPTLRPGLAACVVAATVGLAVNDSGATVPAMAMTLAVPLAIALLDPPRTPTPAEPPRDPTTAGAPRGA